MKIHSSSLKTVTIEIEEPHEQELFAILIEDASGPADQSFAKKLAIFMNDNPDWEEFVVPELDSFFTSQIEIVKETLSKVSEFTQFEIDQATAEPWFSCLNQARINLENHYDLSLLTEEDFKGDQAALIEDKHHAFMRYEFYGMLQGLLLDQIMVA